MSTSTDYVPGSRRRALIERRRRRRRHMQLALLVLAAVAAVSVVAYFLLRGDDGPAPTATEQGRTQQTLLFQVRDASGAQASALLAHDPASDTGAVVLVPPQVIVDVPGSGSMPFGQTLSSGDPNSARNALADLLGVTIDDTWVVSAEAFVALVDALGGIRASVDQPVVQNGQVVVPQGEQLLTGAQALALLGFLADGEQEQARQARVQEVVDGVLAALPDDPDAVAQLLTQLGTGSVSSAAPAELARFLVGLQQDEENEALQYDTLPVIPIDPGGGVTAFRLDEEATRALVDRALGQSVPPGQRETGNRVLVLNGVGTPGLGEAVRAKLVAQDFVFVGSRNAERFGYETTQILVPEATPEAQQLGERVAAALGVAPDVRQADLGTVADVVVIVGRDFQP